MKRNYVNYEWGWTAWVNLKIIHSFSSYWIMTHNIYIKNKIKIIKKTQKVKNPEPY